MDSIDRKRGMRLSLLIAFLGSTVLCLSVRAEDLPTSNDSGSYFLCKNNKAVRTIRVEISEAGCKTTYTKSGLDSVAAKNSKPDKCQPVADRIRTNLETANWSCRDISAARLSFSR